LFPLHSLMYCLFTITSLNFSARGLTDNAIRFVCVARLAGGDSTDDGNPFG
jgi:hypothetical protein